MGSSCAHTSQSNTPKASVTYILDDFKFIFQTSCGHRPMRRSPVRVFIHYSHCRTLKNTKRNYAEVWVLSRRNRDLLLKAGREKCLPLGPRSWGMVPCKPATSVLVVTRGVVGEVDSHSARYYCADAVEKCISSSGQ